MTSLRLCVAVFAVLSSPLCVFAAAPPRYLSHDAYLCQVAGQSTTSADLLAYLRQRCASPDDARRAEKLIDQLGDDDYQTRQAATRELEALGIVALPVLRKHKNHADLDVKRSIAWLLLRMAPLENLGRNLGAPLSRSVVRLLAKSDEAGVAETLMRYLPFADCPETEEALYYALDELHARGVAGRVLTAALGDTSAARRALAACLLAKSADAKLRAASKSMLKDRAALVRLRVAQGMLAAKAPDRDALPALIELLRDESHEVTWQAEELLRYAVGRWMPAEVVGHNTPAEREKCYKAWVTWWKEWEKDIDLTRLHYSRRRPGLMMAYLPAREEKETHDRVALFGCDGVPRYTMEMPRQTERVITAAFRVSGEMLRLSWNEKKEGYTLVQHGLDGTKKWERGWADRLSRAGGLHLLPEGRCLAWSSQAVVEFDQRGQELRRAKHEHWIADQVRVSSEGQFLGIDGVSIGMYGEQPKDWPPPDATFGLRGIDPWTGAASDSQRLAGALAGGSVICLPTGEVFAWVYQSGIRGRRWVEYDVSGRRVREYAKSGQVIAKLANGDLFMGYPKEVTPDGRTVWHAITDRGIEQAAVVLPLVRFGFERPADAKPFDLDTPAEWAKALSDERVLVRRWALAELYVLVRDGGRLEGDILQAVIDRLRDTDSQVYRMAYSMIGELKGYREVPDAAIPYLIGRLVEKGGYYCNALAFASKEAIPPLIELASASAQDKGTVKLRSRALFILANHALRHQDDRAVKAIKTGLQDNDLNIVLECIHGIHHNSERGDALSPRVLVRKGVRHSFQEAAGFIPLLMQLTESKDNNISAKAISAIGSMGDAAGDAVPLMLRLSNVPRHNALAVLCLGQIGGNDKRVVPFLLKCLNESKDAPVRSAAVSALARFGPKKEVVAALIEALKDRKPDERLSFEKSVRGAAAWHLEWFEGRAVEALPALLAIVSDKTEIKEVRISAIYALWAIRDSKAGPTLAKIASDPKEDRNVQERATRALETIDPATANKLWAKGGTAQ